METNSLRILEKVASVGTILTFLLNSCVHRPSSQPLPIKNTPTPGSTLEPNPEATSTPKLLHLSEIKKTDAAIDATKAAEIKTATPDNSINLSGLPICEVSPTKNGYWFNGVDENGISNFYLVMGPVTAGDNNIIDFYGPENKDFVHIVTNQTQYDVGVEVFNPGKTPPICINAHDITINEVANILGKLYVSTISLNQNTGELSVNPSYVNPTSP